MREPEARGFARSAVLRANSLPALRDAAAAGLGLVVLPCYVGDATRALVPLGEPIGELASALWLLTHPDLRRAARVRAVLDGLAELLRPLRPLFAGVRQAGSVSIPASASSLNPPRLKTER